jgi:enoyl-[acyl-carrier-protein] reductase (NADH)
LSSENPRHPFDELSTKDKKAIVFGIANDKSIAWHIAKRLNEAGCRIATTWKEGLFKTICIPWQILYF